MCRKPISSVLALVFCLASSSYAATITWVSDNKNPTGDVPADQGWVDLLEANGYTVDLSFRNAEGRDLNDAKIAALNAADLIIVSRDINSGDYDDGDEPTQWNSVTTPIILQAAHIYRSSRWRWMDSTSTEGTTAMMLAVLPDHPVFAGVTLDENNEVEVTNISTSVGNDNVSPDNNYTLIATRSDANGVWIAEWETGVEYYPGSGQFAGGPRMYFAAGGRGDQAEDGQYNLTAEGEKLFLNAVRYMLGSFNPAAARNPSPADKKIVDLADVSTLNWSAGENAARHDVYFGAVFDDVNDADTSDPTGVYRGRQSSVIYTPEEILELGTTYYWRIDEIEADNATVHRGNIWSFTVAEYLTVDDFEHYNDNSPFEIFSTWVDGWDIPANGSTVGYPDPDFAREEHFVETQIVHGGRQTMPYFYNNVDPATFSEAKMTLSFPRDWTMQGLRALSLWLSGYPPFLGRFVEGPVGTYTMTAGGADIGGDSDQFHFAWQELSGSGTIEAKVEGIQNTDGWAKAGVMIRDTLDADSPHAMVAVTPSNGIWFGWRETAGGGSDSIGEPGIATPQWVKLERSIGGLVRAYYSTDGTNWTPFAAPEPVIMDTPMYIGLALTSHSPGIVCEAKFSNVTSNGTGTWTNQDIGLLSNEVQPMYVAVSNQYGTTGMIYHEDANATLINAWTEWNIDLRDFSDQGVDLTDVNSIAIGFGDKDLDSTGQAGGAGMMYFDDIRLYRPRYVPDKVTPLTADFTDDGLVDFRDLEIMTKDWLKADSFETGLLTHLAFDEASGDTTSDSSGNDHDATIVGATWHAGGYDGTGWSLEFAGDGGHVIDEDAEDYLNGLSALTVCMWIKSNLVDTDHGFINGENPDGGDNVIVMRYDAAGSSFAGTNVFKMAVTSTPGGEQQLESSDNLQTTDWQHVAMTWSSGDLIRFYINAVEDTQSGRNGANNAGTVSGCTKLIIGKGSKDQATDAGWDGLIDDVRIYKRALSQPEIETVKNGGTLTELHYYPLESVANVVDDEPAGSKSVNFKDFAVLADQWLEELVWPEF